MTPKQRRARNKASRAISELANETLRDLDAFNQSIELIARSLGTLIGTATAAHGETAEVMQAASTRAARYAQEHAAKSYGAYLAAEKSRAGTSH